MKTKKVIIESKGGYDGEHCWKVMSDGETYSVLYRDNDLDAWKPMIAELGEEDFRIVANAMLNLLDIDFDGD